MTGRTPIHPDSPAHDGRQRWRCLTRKVVTAWAPFYVSVDFDHEANPVRVHVSQPGKKMGTEFGDVIDAIGEACTEALTEDNASSGPISAKFYVKVEHRTDLNADLPTNLRINWRGRTKDLSIQDMLRQIEGAITGLIQEARAA